MIIINKINKINKIKKIKKINVCIIPAFAAFFNIIIILFPKTALSGAGEGLTLWFNKVIPSLLPFLIGTSLLNSLGFCSFLGVLFSPLMNKIFKISGEGAYALAVGLTSGYPIGAKTTCELRQSGILQKNEAQRLLGFANNSGPLFILGTAASSMLMCPKIGYIMLFIHYASAIITGLFLRLFRSKSEQNKSIKQKATLKNAVMALILFREKNQKPFGTILSQSIKSSIETIAQIGGFIVLFSVISKIIILLTNNFFQSNYIKGLIIGIIEITNGCAFLAQDKTPLCICIITAIISWGGLSIHSQSIALIVKSDLSPLLYILSKLFQGICAFFISLIFIPIIKNIIAAEEVFLNQNSLNIFKDSSFCFIFLCIAMVFIPVLILGINFIIYNIKKLGFGRKHKFNKKHFRRYR